MGKLVEYDLITNSENEDFYHQEIKKDLEKGGGMPHDTAITNLICDCIEKRNYKIQRIGGICEKGERLKPFDVVAHINSTNDVTFGVVGNVFDDEITLLFYKDGSIVSITV